MHMNRTLTCLWLVIHISKVRCLFVHRWKHTPSPSTCIYGMGVQTEGNFAVNAPPHPWSCICRMHISNLGACNRHRTVFYLSLPFSLRYSVLYYSNAPKRAIETEGSRSSRPDQPTSTKNNQQHENRVTDVEHARHPSELKLCYTYISIYITPYMPNSNLLDALITW